MVSKSVRFYLFIFYIAFCFSFFFSCHEKKGTSFNFFHYNEQSGIASLDPAFAKNQSVIWPVHQLFNTLVEVNDSLKIVPSLAKNWTVSQDKLVYTFTLRSDVFFHDDGCFPGGKGRKLTAGDVVYSYNRIIDPEVASPGSWIFNGKIDTSEGFQAIDDTTFRIKLLMPYSPILGILSMQYCAVIPREAVDKYKSDFRRHPVGTGPFLFVAWEEGLNLIMHKNPHYFEKDSNGIRLPYIDGINVSFYDNRATEFLLFRQKQLDFINDIDASFKDEVLTKKGKLQKEWQGKIQLQTHPYLNIEYLGILVDSSGELIKKSPLRFKKIRQAINYGFDRKKMVMYLRNSLGTPAEAGFIPKGMASFDSSVVHGYSYDPEKTKQLLAEAGFPDGNNLPEIKLLTIPIYSDMAGFIAKQLEESGIKVQIEIVQKSLLLQLTSSGKAAFFRGSWIADYPDAENYLSVFYSKNPAPPNYTRYKNPLVDTLFEKALLETNDSVRFRLYQQADQIIINDAPVIPLWYDEVVRFVQPGIKGFQPNRLNLLELRKVKLK